MKTEQIVYEPHPVTAERKAQLRAQGCKIIDAQFKPADAEPESAPEAPTEKAPRKSKSPKPEA